MNTTKATYWIALAVFALALNSEYRHGQFPALHRVADRAGSTLCQITTRAEQTFALARFVIGRQAIPANDLLASGSADLADARVELQQQPLDRAEMVRDQMHAQADILRAQVELQREQIQQIALRASSDFRVATADDRRVVVTSSKGCTNVRVKGNSVSVPAPDPSNEDEDLF